MFKEETFQVPIIDFFLKKNRRLFWFFKIKFSNFQNQKTIFWYLKKLIFFGKICFLKKFQIFKKLSLEKKKSDYFLVFFSVKIWFGSYGKKLWRPQKLSLDAWTKLKYFFVSNFVDNMYQPTRTCWAALLEMSPVVS